MMRILDFLTGLIGLPLLGLVLTILRANGLRHHVEQTLIVGKGAGLFWRRRLVFRDGPWSKLANQLGLAHTPDCAALLRGRLALVGPRPLTPLAPHAVASYRIALRPGLISPFSLRPRGLSAGHGEDAVDFAYACTRTWQGDLDLLFRALWQALLTARASDATDAPVRISLAIGNAH